MSYHVFVKVKMRAVDARRVVREFKKEYGDRIEDARKKWNRSILCIEPIAELTGKCVVGSWLGSPENVYLRLTVRTGI